MLKELHRSLKAVFLEEEEKGETISTNIPEKHLRRIQRNKKRTSREFWIDAQVARFHIKDTMLDLGSDVNIFPKKTWEVLGKMQLKHSPIQLRMEN